MRARVYLRRAINAFNNETAVSRILRTSASAFRLPEKDATASKFLCLDALKGWFAPSWMIYSLLKLIRAILMLIDFFSVRFYRFEETRVEILALC